jgi:hypothetical protein
VPLVLAFGGGSALVAGSASVDGVGFGAFAVKAAAGFDSVPASVSDAGALVADGLTTLRTSAKPPINNAETTTSPPSTSAARRALGDGRALIRDATQLACTPVPSTEASPSALSSS